LCFDTFEWIFVFASRWDFSVSFFAVAQAAMALDDEEEEKERELQNAILEIKKIS
jgi:hypothetical protein